MRPQGVRTLRRIMADARRTHGSEIESVEHLHNVDMAHVGERRELRIFASILGVLTARLKDCLCQRLKWIT